MNKLSYRRIINILDMLIMLPDNACNGYSRLARSGQRILRQRVRRHIGRVCYILWLAAGAISLTVQADISVPGSQLTVDQPTSENDPMNVVDVSGSIHSEGSGSDGNVDYTQIIARSATVNARLHARDLKEVTGRNPAVAGDSMTPIKTRDALRPAFALDVVALGGMYANKITLAGTERGLGVRNSESLGAGAGELRLSVDGRLGRGGKLHNYRPISTRGKAGLGPAISRASEKARWWVLKTMGR